ncbi:MAG: hypothetical protein E7091_05450 [Bacteroidales bacterium]|nr:hypothetical protein [Bacteroidales bacterium]
MKTKSKNIWILLVSALSVCVAAVAWFFMKKKKATTESGENSPTSVGGDTSVNVPTKAIGYRINNPLNIRYSSANNWKGQTGELSGFCVFDTPENGIRAAMVNLKSYRKQGVVTIGDIVSRWAPPTENNTQNYIDFVCKKLGANISDEVEQDAQSYTALLQAMCIMEIGAQPYDVQVWAKAAQTANL